jgi:alpha-beta hydrolase superfamily lysophospholipase
VNVRLRLLLAVALPVACFVSIAQAALTIELRGRPQELHAYGVPGNRPVILSSGDLGWAGLVVHVAQFLSERGCYVVGFNSKAYLSSFTTRDGTLNPADVPRDYRTLVEFVRRQGAGRPILAGVSEGAGLSVLAATDASLKNAIQGVLALGLPDQNELGWRWQDFTIWVTKKAPNEPSFMVEDIIGKVSPIPLAEIHSTHDEFVSLDLAKSMFARAGEPKRMWVIEAANHRFSDNRDELDRRLIEALDWLQKR